MNHSALTRNAQARRYAVKRLAHDLKECEANPLPSIAARPVNDDLLRWHGNITGPPGTAFEGYFFHIELDFPDTYPRESPKVRMLTPLNHDFVFKQHKYICINMLENEWDANHISVTDRGQMYTGWSSAYTVQAILVQLQAFLFDTSYLFRVSDSQEYARKYECAECEHTNSAPCPKPSLDWSEADGAGEQGVQGQGNSMVNNPEAKSDPEFYDLSDDVYQILFAYLDPRTLRTMRALDDRFERIIKGRVDRDRIRSELRCFFSKMSYLEEVLGVGLTIAYYPRGGTIKEIEPTLDLLGSTAYHDLDQRKGVWKEQFTHFLPLYISRSHGERSLVQAVRAMRDMCSAMSMSVAASRVTPDTNAVLTIIPKILNTMVVNTMKGSLHESVRALQGYCYFNHLFLALCDEMPEIRKEVDQRIGSFLQHEVKRTKKECPALGDWITMLLVSDRYSWADVCDAYLMENFDRNVRWIEQKERTYCEFYLGSYDRRRMALEGTDVSRKLAMFHVLFLKTLREEVDPATGASRRLSTRETMARLDETYGRPSFDMERAIQPKVKAIKEATTWDAFFKGVDRDPLSNDMLDRWLVTAMHNSRDKRYHRSRARFPPKPHMPKPKPKPVAQPKPKPKPAAKLPWKKPQHGKRTRRERENHDMNDYDSSDEEARDQRRAKRARKEKERERRGRGHGERREGRGAEYSSDEGAQDRRQVKRARKGKERDRYDRGYGDMREDRDRHDRDGRRERERQREREYRREKERRRSRERGAERKRDKYRNRGYEERDRR